ncbi:regulatory protein GemA [Bowmanella denitrificans]|uniref:regulatory protein GemA n=1 Tax=Bowmanella denitrificans TaxID=366582 RepID=UPI000C9D203E|nr:regulatory protein GemA [Bowmanella denitrificans]
MATINLFNLPDSKQKQLIAIAAQEAGFDTQDKDPGSEYRQTVLRSLTGKTSTSQMTRNDRVKVLQHFIQHGFKLTAKGNYKPNPTWLRKLLSLWATMHQQGFIREPGFAALERWAQKQLTEYCKAVSKPVPSKLDWMNDYSSILIECLKKYHHRALIEAVPRRFEHFVSSVLTKSAKHASDGDLTEIQLLFERVHDIHRAAYPVCQQVLDTIDGLQRRYGG